jgi:hypothetical protein
MLTALALGAAALGIPGSTAIGGIRDLAKSAKDKATKVAGQKSSAKPDGGASGSVGQDIRFDDTMLELGGDVLDKLLACRQEAAPLLDERAALVARRDVIQKEIDALSEKHGDAIAENSNQRAEAQNCADMALDEARQQKIQAAMAEGMANPRSMEKVAKLTAAMNDAQFKGDTATVRRLGKEVDAMYAPTRADTLAAETKCGRLPALHPAKLRIDALDKELAEIDQEIRELDEKAMKLQVAKCGMTEGQIAMAWERIELYLQYSQNDGSPRGFSGPELSALGERKSALAAALKG